MSAKTSAAHHLSASLGVRGGLTLQSTVSGACLFSYKKGGGPDRPAARVHGV